MRWKPTLRRVQIKALRLSATVVLHCWSWWVYLRLLWRLLSLLRSSADVRSEPMLPTDIIGAKCPLCEMPLILAWREVAGTRHPWRTNVEGIVSCDCDNNEMVAALGGPKA